MSRNRMSKVILVAMVSVLLVLSLLFFVSSHKGLSRRLTTWPALASAKMSQVFQSPTEWFEGFSSDFRSLMKTYEENKSLKKRLVSLENQERVIKELKEDNELLRQKLELTDTFAGSQIISTRVISRSTVAWLDFVTVDKGTEDKVVNKMLLVSEQGLLGVVSQVTSESSKVTLLTNTSVHEPLALKLSSGKDWVYGILLGYDEEKAALKVGQFNQQNGIEEGALVLTSGLDGGSMADVPVGEVMSVERDQDQAVVAYVTLAVDNSELSQAHLIGRDSYAD